MTPIIEWPHASKRERERRRTRISHERGSCRSFDAESKHDAYILPLVSQITRFSLLPSIAETRSRYATRFAIATAREARIFLTRSFIDSDHDGISPYRPLSILTDNLRQNVTRHGKRYGKYRKQNVIPAAVSAHRLEYLRKRHGRLNFLPLRSAPRLSFLPQRPTFPKCNSIRCKLM